MKQLQKNDKGFSLIELIVTIAIMAILSVGAVYGISSLTGFYAKQAGELLYQAVSETKVDTMSKGEDVYMKVYQEGDSYWLERDGGEKKKLGSTKRILISYEYTGGKKEIKKEKEGLIVRFKKGTGAFRTIEVQDENGQVSDTTAYCTKLIVQTASKNRTKTLEFYPDTGKCDYHEN
ncbi:MAG: Tfp pilus assembly protein FimT/FimU [Lachnospiraceae bacterium]